MKMNEFAYLRAQRDWKGAAIALTMTTDGQKYTRSSKIKQKQHPSDHNEAMKGAQASKH